MSPADVMRMNLPLACSSGTSRAPLGVAVCAGMLVATVLTLYVVPVAWGALAKRKPLGRAVVEPRTEARVG